MPLPGSPVSMSTGEDTSASQSHDSDSDHSEDLITPRPGPAAPENRTHAALSRPADLTAAAFNRPNSFKEWPTDNIRERLQLTDEEELLANVQEESDASSHGPSEHPEGPFRDPSKSQATSPPRGELGLSSIVTVASSQPSGPASPSLSSNPSSSSRVPRPRSASIISQKLSAFRAKTTSTTIPSITHPERTRSISFHPSSYSRPAPLSEDTLSPSAALPSAFLRRASPRGSLPDLADDIESSADERTHIVKRKMPPGQSQAYGTSQDPHATGYDGAAEESDRPRRAPRKKWTRRLVDKYGSIELENKGSVARDHLALERTFLAWLRTSLSFASIGIAVTQLFRLSTSLQNRNTRSLAGYTAAQLDGTTGPAATIDATAAEVAVLGWHTKSGLQTSDFLTALASSPDIKRLSGVGKPLGATFLGVSILILFVGFHRYFEAQHYIIRGKFPASRGSVVLVSAVAGALIVASFAVVLGLAPGTVVGDD